jgi:hypothetical protein
MRIEVTIKNDGGEVIYQGYSETPFISSMLTVSAFLDRNDKQGCCVTDSESNTYTRIPIQP